MTIESLRVVEVRHHPPLTYEVSVVRDRKAYGIRSGAPPVIPVGPARWTGESFRQARDSAEQLVHVLSGRRMDGVWVVELADGRIVPMDGVWRKETFRIVA